MTITTSGPAGPGPLPAAPAVHPGPAPAHDGAATPADFATLVAQLVAAGAPAAELVDDVGSPEDAASGHAEPDAPANGEPATALGTTALVMAVPPAVVAVPVAGAVGSVPDPGTVAGVAAAAGTDVAAELAPAGSSSIAPMPVPADVSHGSAEGQGAVPVAGPADPADPAASSVPSATRSGSEPASQQAAQPAGQAAPPPVAPAGMTAVVLPAGALPPAPAATAHAAPSPAPPPVAQVVPEVTRLVSRGDGVHRLTMRLQPEALGEVRVTLTVRDGAVQVHLSGGEDAARALAEGAPELRRVLELAGAGDARVVVRDLAGNQPTGHGQPAAGSSADSSAGAASYGADRDTSSTGTPGGGTGQQDHHARTRGGAGATDGLTDGASTLRPDPVTGARQGIDLTM